MSEHKLFGTVLDLVKELEDILIGSSLYREMSPEDKQQLLNYLVISYGDIRPCRNSLN